MFRKLLGIAAAVTVVVTAGMVAGARPAVAGSGWSHSCDDDPTGGDTQIPILRSPVTLAVEIGPKGSVPNHVEICYATTPESDQGAEVAGGALGVNALCQSCYAPVQVYDNADNYSLIGSSFGEAWIPTFTVTPGPPGTAGDTITVFVPFIVCAGQCVTNANVAPTGAIVGQLQAQPAPGQYGVSYQLTSLQVWANGAKLVDLTPAQVGAGVNPFGQVSDSLGSPGGPCLLGICGPIGGYVETTGAAPLLVLQVGGSTIPVGAPKTCLYSNNAVCP